MGAVYRARDPRLGCGVAITVLPAAFAAHEDRLRRLAAALNHPNLVTVFPTMELIEGRSLALAIPKRGLRLDELLTIEVSLTDAIATAHSKGITHREHHDRRGRARRPGQG